jgi:transposase-like protein
VTLIIASDKEHHMPCPQCAETTTTALSRKTALGYRIVCCAVCHRTFNERTGTSFNYLAFPTDVVMLVVLWRLRSTLRLRDLAEMVLERGFTFTHAAVRAWGRRAREPGPPAHGP